MDLRHQNERHESQERLIPPPTSTHLPSTSSSGLPLSLPTTTSVQLLLSAAESSQSPDEDYASKSGGRRSRRRRSQASGEGRRQKSVGFNIDGNIYHYCDYNKKGLLLDVLNLQGEGGLGREFKLMIPFMYCSGKGITIKESYVHFNYRHHQQQKYSNKSKTKSSSSGNTREKEDSGRQETNPSDNFLVRVVILLSLFCYLFLKKHVSNTPLISW